MDEPQNQEEQPEHAKPVKLPDDFDETLEALLQVKPESSGNDNCDEEDSEEG